MQDTMMVDGNIFIINILHLTMEVSCQIFAGYFLNEFPVRFCVYLRKYPAIDSRLSIFTS